MAYDLYPLTVIEEKKMLLAQALEERTGFSSSSTTRTSPPAP